MTTFVSVIVPMHNEEENALATIGALCDVLEQAGWDFEIIPVDDGSTDETGSVLAQAAAEDRRVHPVSYARNHGRGYALRRGFACARGDLIATMDADLSYDAMTAVEMLKVLDDEPGVDLVLASPYMPGGAVEGVPFMRLALSKVGNRVLRLSLSRPIHTSTGIVRAYRGSSLRALDLSSDGKEIHLEILSQAMALGFEIVEIPATLRSRRLGTSKFRPGTTMTSHLAFSLLERSSWLFGAFGLVLLMLSVLLGLYLLGVFFSGGLNPERPLMTVMLILFLGGAIALSFSLLAMLLLEMRREQVRLHADVLRLRDDLASAQAVAAPTSSADDRVRA